MSGALREAVLRYAEEQFQTKAEYLFRRSPQTAVLRHAASKKWYAIVMPVSRQNLGLSGNETVDIINVKCDPLMLGSFLLQEGFLPAYHMAKGSWLSILLDGTVNLQQVCAALHMSYALVSQKQTGRQRTEPKEWLIPANPKYEDLSVSFAQSAEIYWKQSGRFLAGDTVYIYEGMPIGAITYACEVIKTDIPYHAEQGELRMDIAMQLVLRARYAPTQFPRARLLDYGITGVRGPRGIPEELSAALKISGVPIR